MALRNTTVRLSAAACPRGPTDEPAGAHAPLGQQVRMQKISIDHQTGKEIDGGTASVRKSSPVHDMRACRAGAQRATALHKDDAPPL